MIVSAGQTLPERAPERGELVQVRSRRWLVEDIVPADIPGQSPIVQLSCAHLLADTISEIFSDGSVSAVVGGENQLF